MSDEDDENMSGNEDDEDEDIQTLKKRALLAIQDEIDENDNTNSDEGDDSDAEDSEEDDIQVAMNFNDKNKSEKKRPKNEDKGIMGLKFMMRGEERLKEQNKLQAKMLMEQIREDQEILDQSENEHEQVKQQSFVKGAANKFAKSTL